MLVRGVHDRRDDLAEPFVGYADDHHLRHRIMFGEDVFDVNGRDVLATADDEFLQSPGDRKVAAVIHDAEIAGAHKAVWIDCGRGGVGGVMQVIRKLLVAPGADLADLTGSHHPSRRRISHLAVHLGQRAADGMATVPDTVHRPGQSQHRCEFGLAVEVVDGGTEHFAGVIDELGIHRRRSAHDHRELRSGHSAGPLVIDQRRQHRGHVEQHIDGFVADRLEDRAGREAFDQDDRAAGPQCPRVPMTHPAVWNIGSGLRHTGRSGSPAASTVNLATLTSERCRNATPLGRPVVPDVYCSMTISSVSREQSSSTAGSGTSAHHIA